MSTARGPRTHADQSDTEAGAVPIDHRVQHANIGEGARPSLSRLACHRRQTSRRRSSAADRFVFLGMRSPAARQRATGGEAHGHINGLDQRVLIRGPSSDGSRRHTPGAPGRSAAPRRGIGRPPRESVAHSCIPGKPVGSSAGRVRHLAGYRPRRISATALHVTDASRQRECVRIDRGCEHGDRVTLLDHAPSPEAKPCVEADH